MFGLMGRINQSPLDQPLVSHVGSISPIEWWNSRCTRKSIYPKDIPPRKGWAYNSTTVDRYTPLQYPLSPIMETKIYVLQSHGLSSEDTIVQDIMTDPNINPNLLQTATDTLSSRINIMQSAQATLTLGKIDSSGFDTRGQDLKPKPQPLLTVSVFDHQSSGLGGQATPTSSSSPFVHQESAIESSESNSSQSNHSSNNQSQHPPST